MRSMVTKRTQFLLLILWLTTPPAFAITYHTLDVDAATGGTFGLVDGLFAIRGDATDFDLTPFQPPEYANPNGSLSASFTSYSSLGFHPSDYNQFFYRYGHLG